MRPERNEFPLPEPNTPKYGLVREAVYNFAAAVAFAGALTGAISSERFENIMDRLEPKSAPTVEQ